LVDILLVRPIGSQATPLVRLKKVSKTAGLQCELLKFRIEHLIFRRPIESQSHPFVRLRKGTGTKFLITKLLITKFLIT
jgi:hypothetical protein